MAEIGNFDPRNAWDHARRIELVRHANELGYKDITEQMPKDIIVKRLMALGAPPPSTPMRPLQAIGGAINHRSGDTRPGSHKNGSAIPVAKETEIDASELLEQEYKTQSARKLSFNEMRAELKAGGVKLNRRWDRAEVKAQWETMRSGK